MNDPKLKSAKRRLVEYLDFFYEIIIRQVKQFG